MAHDRKVSGRIAVLMGGYSAEREVSLKSGKAVYNALKDAGADVISIDILEKNEDKIKGLLASCGMDVAFIALHGTPGEDGAIQTILEGLNIPYTGSRPEAHQLAFNKVTAQTLFHQHGISIPRYISFHQKNFESIEQVWPYLDFFPVIIKPATEGSSIGITVVHKKERLEEALKTAWEFGETLLIEQFIKGRELTVGILEEEALPIVEIRSSHLIFDYSAKYQAGLTEYIVPAELSPEMTKKIQTLALQAHRVLGCRHLSRVDCLLDVEGIPYILEVNTIPGFTETSLLPKAARSVGIEFSELCLKLVELAYGSTRYACGFDSLRSLTIPSE